MRSFILPLFSVSLLGLAVADPILSPSVLHAKRDHVPHGWSRDRKYPSSSVIPLRFGLSQPNLHDMEAFVNDIAHPDSPNFGNHWTPEQVIEKFSPSSETVHTVKDWLLESGFTTERVRVTKTKGWVEVNATVEEAERLLNAEYHVYKHATGKEHVACDAYHLPAHVKPHVELVTPTVDFNAIISRAPKPVELEKRVGPSHKIGVPGQGFNGPKTSGQIATLFDQLEKCDEQISPICLRALYGLVYSPLAASKNSFGIVEYTPQAYVPSDIDNFAKNFSKSITGKRPTVVSIDGGVVQTTDTGFEYNGESNLDLQYGMALVGPKQTVTLYQVGDTVEGASFDDLLDAFDGSFCAGDDPLQDGTYPDPLPGGYQGPKDCGTVKPANVISTSYGYNEADLTPAYTARQCAEYAKLGLTGVTVLYSSGDNGVAGNGALCLNPDGSQTEDGKLFNPSFPGGCPYVTSVGATQVSPGKSVLDPESACEQVIYSGGGFSNHFAIPDYQKSAVQSYLTNNPPPYDKSLYNSTGNSRAFPDLSANGANYAVSIQGAFYKVFGTSASSPVVGAILTLVNDARLAVGKKPIGFINPTIYSSSFKSAFHDITNGTNPGCGTDGFKTAKGWDPVTGLGTPNFPLLVAKWLLLP